MLANIFAQSKITLKPEGLANVVLFTIHTACSLGDIK